MAYPKLVQKFMLNAVVNMSICSDGLDEDGQEITVELSDLRCNLQWKNVQKMTAQKEIITLSGRACFDGDICPNVPIKGGELTFNGETYSIFTGQKHLNPDGTVNYTSVELS